MVLNVVNIIVLLNFYGLFNYFFRFGFFNYKYNPETVFDLNFYINKKYLYAIVMCMCIYK